jgi:hypothetical protein
MIMIYIEDLCPFCRKSFSDPKHKIDNYPAETLEIELEGKRGWLRLSALYGSYKVESELEIPIGAVVKFYCPHCGKDLGIKNPCEHCGAPMVRMLCRPGGYIHICSRRGCKKHHVAFDDLQTELRAFYDTYGTFFKP